MFLFLPLIPNILVSNQLNIGRYLFWFPLFLRLSILNVLSYLQLKTNNLDLPKINGRFEYFKPNIILDVGHNVLAASAIRDEFIKQKKQIILIYNSYKEKKYNDILEIFKPIVKSVMIINCIDKRMVDQDILKKQSINLI